MKISVVLLAVIAHVRSDVGLGYRYKVPATSYDVPFGSVDRQYYHVGIPNGIVVTTPSSILENTGGFDVTPSSIHVENTGLPGGFDISTPSPIHVQNTGGIGVTTPSSIHIENTGIPGGLGLTTPASLLQTPIHQFTSFTGKHNIPTFQNTEGQLGSAQVDLADQNQNVEVQKHLYFFSAPEETEEVRTRIIAPPAPTKKNVKILFIKAPTYKTAPIQVPVQPQNEDKTLVYVLVKKPEEQAIIIPTPPPAKAAKPEVFFIKYKTQKEAEEAVANVRNGARGDASISANSVEGDQTFLSGIQDNKITSNGGFDLGQNLVSEETPIISTEHPVITYKQPQQVFNGFVKPKTDFVSTTLSPEHPGFGYNQQVFNGFVQPKSDFLSTTLGSLSVTTPTPFSGDFGHVGVHKVYGPPQRKRSVK